MLLYKVIENENSVLFDFVSKVSISAELVSHSALSNLDNLFTGVLLKLYSDACGENPFEARFLISLAFLLFIWGWYIFWGLLYFKALLSILSAKIDFNYDIFRDIYD